MEINLYVVIFMTITFIVLTALIGYGARLEQKYKSFEKEKEKQK